MRCSARLLWLSILAMLLVGCPHKKADPDPPVTETLPGEIVSLSVGEPGWVLTRYGLYDPERSAVGLPAGEAGHRLSAAWVDPGGATLWLGYEVGRVYRSTDGGASWSAELAGYLVPDVVIIDLALRRPIPRQFLRAADQTLYLATVGRGLLRWDDVEGAWVDGTWRFDLEGSVHPLTWSAGALGQCVVAGFANPAGLLPPDYTNLFGTLVRTLEGPGADPVQLPELPTDVRLVADMAERDARILVATLGQGVYEWLGAEWRGLGPAEPPADVIAMDVDGRGRVALLTLTGDVWLLDGDGGAEDWRRVRCGETEGERGADLRWSGERLQVAVGADIEDFAPVTVVCPERGGATVLLAFSQHTNLYHSYRGDTPDDDGYGKDIDIIRSTIEIFDRHPQFKNDWDIENLFSLDGWLASEAPDILDDIRRRVEDGQDGIRLMSWNNGLMTNETADEFAASVVRAQESLEAFVPGLWAPGVQPQENTFTPAHVQMYPELGIDWITLFYSATSFTGFRHEVGLTLAEGHGVLSLRSALYPEASMKLVPVYHHADVLEHGGLANWLRQLHQNLEGTVALVIHFDADGDTWLGFEADLEAVEALGADWVVPARIQDIVEQLPVTGTVTLHRDLADGAFDGLSSWTEKPVNHRFYTRIVRSRLYEEWTRTLAATLDATASEGLDDAFEARLRSLSTTHFGLANPDLHPTREATGDASTLEAEQRSRDALLHVLASSGLAPLTAHNPGDTEVTFVQPVTSATPLAASASAVRFLHSTDGTRQWMVGTLAPGESVALDSLDASLLADPEDWGVWGPVLDGVTVTGPRLRVAGVDYGAVLTGETRVFGNGGEVITLTGEWEPGHGGTGGTVRYDWIHHDADPDAWWVEVTVTYPTLDDEELRRWWDDAVPLEVALAGRASWAVERPLITGEVAQYSIAEPLDALNSHAADGWVRLLGEGDTAGLSLTNFQPLRAAPGFLPLRLSGDSAGLAVRAAPFGALWGELLDHRARSLLGTGLAEMTSRLTGAQFHATAPAWNGETVCFLLRIQPHTPDGDQPTLLAASRGVLLLDGGGVPLLGRPACF